MKIKFRLVGLVIILFVFAQPASAQGFLNKISKKVKDKIEQKVENKVDEKVDEKLDEAFDSDDNSAQSDDQKEQERLQKIMKGIGMNGEPVPVEDLYLFDSKIQMHIESYKGNGKLESEGDFVTYINQGSKSFAYEFISGDMQETGKGTFIMDFDNSAMIILADDEGEQKGIVYGMNMSLGEMMDDDYKDLSEEEMKNINMNPYLDKTGRSKTISGYKCDEYKYDNPEDDSEAYFWVSKDANVKTRDLMSTMFKSAAYSRGMPWGFVMESEVINKQNNERTVMRVTDIDDNANKKFSLKEYTLTNLGSMNISEEVE